MFCPALDNVIALVVHPRFGRRIGLPSFKTTIFSAKVRLVKYCEVRVKGMSKMLGKNVFEDEDGDEYENDEPVGLCSNVLQIFCNQRVTGTPS